MRDNKREQLGMDPGTASHRLIKDLLFDFAIKAGHVCFRCGKPLDRKTFSIEHKEPWLHTADPKSAFFDVDNIAYSHLGCNAAVTRRKPPLPCGTPRAYDRGCRCDQCRAAHAAKRMKYYTPERRRAQYERHGA